MNETLTYVPPEAEESTKAPISEDAQRSVDLATTVADKLLSLPDKTQLEHMRTIGVIPSAGAELTRAQELTYAMIREAKVIATADEDNPNLNLSQNQLHSLATGEPGIGQRYDDFEREYARGLLRNLSELLDVDM